MALERQTVWHLCEYGLKAVAESLTHCLGRRDLHTLTVSYTLDLVHLP